MPRVAIGLCGAACFMLTACTDMQPTTANGPRLSAEPVRLWVTGNSPGRTARFSADGKLLALSNASGDVFVIRTADWRPIRRIKHPGGATSLAFAPSAALFTAGYDGIIRSWDLRSGRQRKALATSGATILSVDVSADGRRLVVGGEDGLARLWQLDAPTKPPKVLRGHERNIWEVRFSPDGSRIATGSFDQSARLWDVATARPVSVLRGHSQAIVGLDYRPDGKALATYGDDSTIRLWSSAGAPQRTIPTGNHTYKVDFSSDGRWLVSAGRARSAVGTALYQLTGLGGATTPVRLWRVADGALVAALPHPTDVMGVAFSPDGRYVVSSDDDGRARLWRISARR